ncbi:MAG: phenylalanine--tRNA ligase subunit beta [Candidatus Bathyarchaeia archaeon]
MPAIALHRERFSKFVGRQLTVEEMAKWLPWIGVSLEELGFDYVKVEFNPNRVDFSSHVGVARALKGLMEWETGLPNYVAKKGNVVLNVDSSVAKVRPYILAAVVRNITLDDDSVRELMEMQEDLHWGVGRNRKKASIGVHNLDVVRSPFTYKAVEPESVKFVPLDWAEELTPREILEKHEKGIAYRHLIDWSSTYPLLVDKNGAVLSMPPIINGELTRVSSDTRNLFLDVTGTDYDAVKKSLNVLAAALADMGGTLERVSVRYADREIVSPELSPTKMKLHVAYANKMLGLKLSVAEVIKCLKKCRLGAREISPGILEVSIPIYRIDMLHEVDLVEEVAVGYGYYRIKPTIPQTVTTGEPHKANETANIVRQIMAGLGFIEVMNLVLTNETIHYTKMRQKPAKVIRLANPVSLEYSILRQELLPGLMNNLADNKHEKFPQRIFEASDVLQIDLKAEARCKRCLHVAAVSSHANANFTEMKSFLEALLSNLGLKNWAIKAATHPSFLRGRIAALYFGNKRVGFVGEIHPEVLNNFELENPTAAFEINLEAIFKFPTL